MRRLTQIILKGMYEMMVLKRKEVVAAALVVLIGVAGYLNWSYQDTMRVTDGEEYIATGKKLGEAQLVNKNGEADEAPKSAGYFEEARKNREASRQKALDILNQTAANEAFDEATRKKAQENILTMADEVEQEASIENIIKAKGYENSSVYIDGEKVEIVVQKDGFSDDDAARLSEIATSQLEIPPSNVKIIPVK